MFDPAVWKKLSKPTPLRGVLEKGKI